MGGIYSYISMRVFKQGPRILMVGLDAAGKTTILYKLGGEVVNTIPTIGFNIESLERPHKGVITSFTVWDVGGRDKIRGLWRYYYQDIDSLIYVVDCTDRERIDEAKEQLEQMLEEDMLKQCALLVCANKQDLPNAMNVHDVIEKLGLQRLRHRRWYAQATCAVTGSGLSEGLDWLMSQADAPIYEAGPFEKSDASDAQFKQKGGPSSIADTNSTADTDDETHQLEISA